MNVPRQMINLIGIVLVVGILVAGIALIALPPYGSAQAIDVDTRNVAQTNQLYQVRVTSLSEAAEHMDELTADVTQLRLQIPASSHLDDVVQRVELLHPGERHTEGVDDQARLAGARHAAHPSDHAEREADLGDVEIVLRRAAYLPPS